MDGLNLSRNITRLRHARKLTQEELADFVGVTKASVSKWENAQSMPDILLLPQLAAFFGVTIDELVGYEPQLSGKQIRHFYAQLSRDFASLSFHEALEKARFLAHRYYSCYPFLLQLVVLYWNHYMLAESEEEGRQILEEAVTWCDRILGDCTDVRVCSDAASLKAGLQLQLGRAAEAIGLLEPLADPSRISRHNSAMLIQAYRVSGEIHRAKIHAQAGLYLDLVDLVGDGIQLLSLYENDMERCRETIRRTGCVIEIFQLEWLRPDLAAQFYYQTAVVYGIDGKSQEALGALQSFDRCVRRLLDAEKIELHGDGYFDLLDTWIDGLPLGSMAPRDKSFIRQNIQEALSHPAFKDLRGMEGFQRIMHLQE